MAICISYNSIPSLDETVKRVQVSEDGYVMWVTLSSGKQLVSRFFDTNEWPKVRRHLAPHVIVDDENVPNFEPDAGKYYWAKNKHESVWRVWYIGLDPDDNKWVHQIDIKPLRLDDMDLSEYDIKEAKPC